MRTESQLTYCLTSEGKQLLSFLFMGYLTSPFPLICVSFTSLSGSKNDTLSIAEVLWFTYKVPGVPTHTDQQKTSFASSWGHVAWPAAQSPASVCFSSALTPQGSAGIFCCSSFSYVFFRWYSGMLLSGVSETLKYAVFSHGCCTGKILENFPQVTYDI